MNDTYKNLKINIDGIWTVEELNILLHDLNDLYSFRIKLELLMSDYKSAEEVHITNLEAKFRLNYGVLFRTESKLLIGEKLRINKIEYGSNGFVDLIGLGKVVEQLRILLTDISNVYHNIKDRNQKIQLTNEEINKAKLENIKKESFDLLEIQQKEEELKKLKIQNIQLEQETQFKNFELIEKYYSVLDKIGLSQSEKKEILLLEENKINNILKLISEQKIKSIE